MDAARGEELAQQLGTAAAFKQTDVASADDVQDLVDFAVARFGGLHVMFNNAGIAEPIGGFLDDELKDFQRMMAVNLFGVMVCSQRAARHMAKHGGGSIINNSSIGGISAGGGVMTYRAAKAAVTHFSKCIAIELAPHGIRVNCIAPGHIATEMTPYDMEAVVRLHPAAAAAGFAERRRERRPVPRERTVGADHRDRVAGRWRDDRRHAGQPAEGDHGRARQRDTEVMLPREGALIVAREAARPT